MLTRSYADRRPPIYLPARRKRGVGSAISREKSRCVKSLLDTPNDRLERVNADRPPPTSVSVPTPVDAGNNSCRRPANTAQRRGKGNETRRDLRTEIDLPDVLSRVSELLRQLEQKKRIETVDDGRSPLHEGIGRLARQRSKLVVAPSDALVGVPGVSA